jgi:CheY-like chemotaxis protein
LVIDDNALFRSLLRLQLEAAGYEVLDAPNGKVGLRVYREQPVDVILCDLFMPEQEGLETIQELRRAGATHIIAMSGDGPVGAAPLLRAALLFGAKVALSKPFEDAELAQALREAMEEG